MASILAASGAIRFHESDYRDVEVNDSVIFGDVLRRN
jgi:hypothetical protein